MRQRATTLIGRTKEQRERERAASGEVSRLAVAAATEDEAMARRHLGKPNTREALFSSPKVNYILLCLSRCLLLRTDRVEMYLDCFQAGGGRKSVHVILNSTVQMYRELRFAK